MDNNIIERIIQLRKQGVEHKNIAKELDVSFSSVRYYCKKNGLVEKKESSNFEAREMNFANKIKKSNINIEYVRGFINQDKPMIIRCTICQHEMTRSGITIRHALRGLKTISCDKCKIAYNHNEKVALKSKRKELKQLRKNLLKQAIKPKPTLIEIQILKCIECGSFFGSKRKRSICSKSCTNRRDNRLKELRKRKLRINGRVDYSITLEKLIQKEKNVCYLCGGQCDLNDFVIDDRGSFIVGLNYPSIEHVIPVSKGGTHTWDNVKLAHHYCNTIKSDKKVVENTGQMVLMI